jgi:hypothetical protein
LDLTREQLAAARAAGCAFFPATEIQVQRLTMQRRIFRLDGKPFMVTRDGGFYETHGTLLRLIEDYQHLIASTVVAQTERQSQPDAAAPIAAPSREEPQEETSAPPPDPHTSALGVNEANAGRDAAALGAAGTKPSVNAGPRSEGHSGHETGMAEASTVCASGETQASANEGTAENIAACKDAGLPMPKRRRVRHSGRLLLEQPARTPPDVFGTPQSAPSPSAEAQQAPLSQISSGDPIEAEAENSDTVSVASDKAVRSGGCRTWASGRGGARAAKIPPLKAQPELPFADPATPVAGTLNLEEEPPEADPPQTSTGRPRAIKRRAGQPKMPRWVTAGAARRGRLK